MGFIGFIISTLISGLIVGAVARLIIPGRQEMSIASTILIGIAGSLVGGLVAWVLGLRVIFAFVVEVLAAAAIVYFTSQRQTTS